MVELRTHNSVVVGPIPTQPTLARWTFGCGRGTFTAKKRVRLSHGSLQKGVTMSIHSRLLDQNGHTFARIAYRPEYCASLPYMSFHNGTAMLHHETPYGAKLYLLNRFNIPMDSWPTREEMTPEQRRDMECVQAD